MQLIYMYLGPNEPTISRKLSKDYKKGDFFEAENGSFGHFWHLKPDPVPRLGARDQNFWTQGGPTTHPKHP